MGVDPLKKTKSLRENSPFAINASVWIPDETHSWLPARVVVLDGDFLLVKTVNLEDGSESETNVKAKTAGCHLRDEEPRGVDDVTHLSFLHEPGLLQNLTIRFSHNQIYTYTGSILIAINPFSAIPHLYDDIMKEQYMGAPLGAQAPHVFAIADSAYRSMIHENRSQSILISGESGAGKTETTKLVLDYLATACGRDSTGSSDIRQIESLLLESNPILEAFGNAKTERNNNSSRFGKFIKVQFDNSGRVSGAAIKSYLLEKSRVVRFGPGERNYHVFYQLCDGASPEEALKYNLVGYKVEDFHYLNQSDCYELEGKGSNAVEFHKLKRSLAVMGISYEEQESLFRMLAGILHIGNIAVELDASEDFVRVKPGAGDIHLAYAAKLLRVDATALESSILQSTMQSVKEAILVPMRDTKSAESRRDSLAKNLYSSLFDWILAKVNSAVGEDKSADVFIGVLDIYGFEHFKTNSFEQFCINLANEKLQQHFNFHVLKTEQEEYEKENINWSRIPFTDNEDCLDLIESRSGILAHLDNACKFAMDAEGFTRKLFSEWTRHPRLTKPRTSRTDFTLTHFAGKVTYSTDEFILKNNDSVIAEHFNLLSSSSDALLAALFPSENHSVKNKFLSLGISFKQQLGKLMDDINNTEPHYIRCIKPNSGNKPKIIQNKFVVSQLRSGGVLEAVRMCLSGYPTRQEFNEFLDRFRLLAYSQISTSASSKDEVRALLDSMHLEGFQIGLTKVFLRAGHMIELETERLEKLNAAQTILRFTSEFFDRKRAAATIVAFWQRGSSENAFQQKLEARSVTAIQSILRMHRIQTDYAAKTKSALQIQTFARSLHARVAFQAVQRQWAATTIQAMVRRGAVIRSWDSFSLLLKGLVARRDLAALLRQKREMERERALEEERKKAEIEAALQAAEAAAAAAAAEAEAAEREEAMAAAKKATEAAATLQLASSKKEIDEPITNIRVLVLRRLKEKAEKARHLSTEKLNAVVKEKQILESELSTKEVELKRLQEELRKARELAFSSATLAETLAKDKVGASFPRSMSLSPSALGAPGPFQESTEEGSGKGVKALETEMFQRLQMSAREASELSVQLKEENQLLMVREQEAKERAQRAEVRLKDEVQGLERELTSRYEEDLQAWKSRLADLEKSLSDKDQEIKVLARHFLSEKSDIQMDPKKQQKALLRAVGGKVLGFSNGHSIAAILIFRAMHYWGVFDKGGTAVFDSVLDCVKCVEKSSDMDLVVYWLATNLTLYQLVQAQEDHLVSCQVADEFRLRAVQYDMEVFKLKLWYFIVYQFQAIRDVTRAKLLTLLRGDSKLLGSGRPPTGPGMIPKKFIARTFFARDRASTAYFLSVTQVLKSLLHTLETNGVSSLVVKTMISQLVRFSVAKIFNNLLNRSSWCPCNVTNGHALKSALEKFKEWLSEVDADFDAALPQSPSQLASELTILEEAVTFLVFEDKQSLAAEDLVRMCKSLSPNHLWHICNNFEDSDYPGVRRKVLASIGDIEKIPELIQDERGVPLNVYQVLSLMAPCKPELVEIPPDLLVDGNLLFLMPSTQEALTPMYVASLTKSPSIGGGASRAPFSTPPPFKFVLNRTILGKAVMTPLSNHDTKRHNKGLSISSNGGDTKNAPMRLVFDAGNSSKFSESRDE